MASLSSTKNASSFDAAINLFYSVLLSFAFVTFSLSLTKACGPSIHRQCMCPSLSPCCVNGGGAGGFYPDLPLNPLQSVLGGNIRMEGKLKEGKLHYPQNVALSPSADRGQVSSSQDLMCTVWDNSCRWRNMDGGVVDWYRGSGTPDSFRLMASTGSSKAPRSPFAIAAMNKVLPSSDSATLASDTIPCQVGDGEIRFAYWTSPQVRITVCWRKGDSQTYDYCSPAITGGDPGPAVIRIAGPIMHPFEIVLNADNYVYNDGRYAGGFAIIDDLEYNAEICQQFDTDNNNFVETKKSQFLGLRASPNTFENIKIISAPPDDVDACRLIECNFREGLCMEYLLRSDFNVHHGPLGNPVTGIRGDGSSLPFNSSGEFAYAVGPQNIARFILPSFSLHQHRRLQFGYYLAAVDTKLRVVSRRSGEPELVIFEAPEASIDSRRWVMETVPLKAGTYEKVTFEALDLQQYTFVGIDEIKLLDAESDRPLC